ncbi:MAG: GGDEF domain-containing protein [Candidatus Pristimantibacillus sp.]
MSTPVRSLEDACEHVIHVLKHIIKANTLFITKEEYQTSYIMKAYNRQESIINEGQALQSDLRALLEAHPHKLVPIPMNDNTEFGAIYVLDKNLIELDENVLSLLESMASLLAYTIELGNATVTDSLTGLYNRRFLDELFDNTEIPLGVMFIDLNEFKMINDKYGHDFGDLLLVEISNRLKRHIRKSDRIIRYGGDEFIICFQNLAENSGIAVVEDKIQSSFSEPFLIKGQSISISASIGVSSNQGLYTSLKQLITDADQAMYHMKRKQSV